ncbi:unnamed protein product [Schistosoma bovis]|nr:unnamed protein product [Schistosoma bovis]
MGDRNSSETAIGPKKISLFVKLNLCTKCCPNRDSYYRKRPLSYHRSSTQLHHKLNNIRKLNSPNNYIYS